MLRIGLFLQWTGAALILLTLWALLRIVGAAPPGAGAALVWDGAAWSLAARLLAVPALGVWLWLAGGHSLSGPLARAVLVLGLALGWLWWSLPAVLDALRGPRVAVVQVFDMQLVTRQRVAGWGRRSLWRYEQGRQSRGWDLVLAPQGLREELALDEFLALSCAKSLRVSWWPWTRQLRWVQPLAEGGEHEPGVQCRRGAG